MINNALGVCISPESLNIHKKMFRKPQTGYINIGLLCKSRNTYKLVSSCYAGFLTARDRGSKIAQAFKVSTCKTNGSIRSHDCYLK